MHCAGPCCSVAAGTCGESCQPTRNGGKCKLKPEDLERVRVFPRAQWRKVANGNFLLRDIVRRIKTTALPRKDAGLYRQGPGLELPLAHCTDDSAVLLIGSMTKQPVTVLEGNHRLTAALLASPEVLQSRFRVFCGFSARMPESCWYQTNVPNLWRYGRNRARNLFYDRDADVERLLDPAAPSRSSGPAALTPVAAEKALTESK